MERRRIPKCGDELSVIGVGLGAFSSEQTDRVEEIASRAIDRGVNFFDACGACFGVFAPFGRAISSRRDEVKFQLHIGATYDENGEYGWTRGIDVMKRTLDRELEALGTDHADYMMLHCVDDIEGDYDELRRSGAIDFLRELKRQGVARRIGFSSHTPSVAEVVLDEIDPDVFMFSINPAFDLERGGSDEIGQLGRGAADERARPLKKCASMGVGVTVMKPFCGGKLLDAAKSPFHSAMSVVQCIQYALDRPAVVSVLPGVTSVEELDAVLAYETATPFARDWSSISGWRPSGASRACVYCGHCHPCPAGINIALANKYYDLAVAGDAIAAGHYGKLAVKAGACVRCRRCESRCPFDASPADRMREILAHFGE